MDSKLISVPLIVEPHLSTLWTVRHFDKNGRLVWEYTGPNTLANEGQYMFLDLVYRNEATTDPYYPTQFYIALGTLAATKTSTMADVTGEPNTNGYARQLYNRNTTDFPTLALDAGDYKVSSKTVTFTASGGSWGPVTYAYLTNLWGNTWQASTSYSVGNWVRPTTPNKHFYKCTTAGTSGATEPTWPTNGSTVNDGTVVWQDMGVGKLYSYLALSTSRTLAAGESLQFSFTAKQT